MGRFEAFERIRIAAGINKGAKALVAKLDSENHILPAFSQAGLRITCIDPEAPELSHPHRKLPMDLSRLYFSDQNFDLIWAVQALPQIRSDYQALWECQRCLKGAGVAVITVPIQRSKTERIEEERAEQGVLWQYGFDFFGRMQAAGLFALRFEGHILAFKYRETRELFLHRAEALNIQGHEEPVPTSQRLSL